MLHDRYRYTVRKSDHSRLSLSTERGFPNVDIEKASKNLPLQNACPMKSYCASAVIGCSQATENIVLILDKDHFHRKGREEDQVASNIHDSATTATDATSQTLSLYSEESTIRIAR